MTEEMKDTSIMAKICGGDLVAIKARSYTGLLIKYRNCHRSDLRQNHRKPNEDSQKIHSLFKLYEVRHLYERHLEHLGKTISVNKIRFKENIMNNLQT